MNILQKQTEFGRSVFEISQNAFQDLARIQQDNLKNHFDLNNDFSQKLTDVQDVAGFVELQRDYSQSLWNGVKKTTKGQAEILRTAIEETGEAVRKVYTVQADD